MRHSQHTDQVGHLADWVHYSAPYRFLLSYDNADLLSFFLFHLFPVLTTQKTKEERLTQLEIFDAREFSQK